MRLTWFGWLFIVSEGFAPLIIIANIGKTRAPVRPADGIGALLVTAFYIWGAVVIGTRA